MPHALSSILAIGKDKKLKAYRAKVDTVNALEGSMEALSDEELRTKADDLRTRATNGELLDGLLPEAFALVRETSKRIIGLRHFDVQLIGAMALHDGAIAEMKTGEGKTLVSTAAGFLNALTGENVHIVTVNDYLAKRDSEWMGRIYRALGFEVGLIQNQMKPAARRPQYQAAVTYGTNSEFGFDYLRDNMVTSPKDRVQRGHYFAIVDEVDSILIDEARTPLIISGLGGKAADRYNAFAAIMPTLKADEDYVLDEKRRTIYATEEGLDKVEAALGLDIYSDLTGKLANHLQQALRAEYLFKLDHDYVVVDGEVKIVDEFTGRIMEGRRYSDGLHQALEAKEHVEIKDETQTLATVTLQNYFRLYDKLSGMTGTALTEDSEFKQIYSMEVIPIPTNKPVIRVDQPDYVYRTMAAKYEAVANEVEERHKKGQPILVGTASIEGSERISRLLDKRGIKHEVLNAKNYEREAKIVAQAGRIGAVTIATNMAGRGTDIQLGGNFDDLTVEKLGLWHVTPETATDLHWEMARKEARYIVDREGYAARVLGGLYVIGTDRHEARRIDNQLRGRSGRQGDPGESRFFLSLEDDLLRRFGQDRLGMVSDMMEKQGMTDDMPISGKLVSKVIGAAQQQVESMHFGSRKNVLEYDDVMNLQRIAIYKERNAILDGKDVDELLPEITGDIVDAAVESYCPANVAPDDWELDKLSAWLTAMTGEVAPSDEEEIEEVEGAEGVEADADAAADAVADDIAEVDEEVADALASDLFDFTEDDDPDDVRDAIVERLLARIDAKRAVVGEDVFKQLEVQIMLRQLDTHWLLHLQDMDRLKAGIGLRALGHRDPLTEYKEEAFEAFADLVDSVYEAYLRTLLRMPVEKPVEDLAPKEEDNPFRLDKLVYSNTDTSGVTNDSTGGSIHDDRVL